MRQRPNDKRQKSREISSLLSHELKKKTENKIERRKWNQYTVYYYYLLIKNKLAKSS